MNRRNFLPALLCPAGACAQAPTGSRYAFGGSEVLGTYGAPSTVFQVQSPATSTFLYALSRVDAVRAYGIGLFCTTDLAGHGQRAELSTTWFGPDPRYSPNLALIVNDIPNHNFFIGVEISNRDLRPVVALGGTANGVELSGTGRVALYGDTVRLVDAIRTPGPGTPGREGEVCIDERFIHVFIGGRWRRAKLSD